MPQVNVKILSPQAETSFIPDWYELASNSHFWMKGRLAAVLRQLKKNNISLDGHLRGLEIGCGHGVLRVQIEKNSNWTVDGCDLDLVSLESNPPSRGEVFLYNIFDRAHFLKSYYDFIILYDVIEHIEKVQPFMEAALYHLKPGGYVLINVPALNSLYSLYDEVAGHYRRYDREMMSKELADCSLEIIHINYWGMSFLPILEVRKMLLKNGDKRTAIKKGFRPPGALINSVLTVMIYGEVAMFPDPISGTSLMAIARKK